MNLTDPSLAAKARARVLRAQAAYDAARDALIDAVSAETELHAAKANGRIPDDILAVIRAVAAFYRLPEHLFFGADRQPHIAQPRCIAMHLCRTLTPHTLHRVGECFGGRDHGTVIHAGKAIEARLSTEPGFHVAWERLFLP